VFLALGEGNARAHFSIASRPDLLENQTMQTRELIGLMRKIGGAGLLLATLLVCGRGFGPPAQGAAPSDTPEEHALRAAYNMLHDGLYALAETNFVDFLAVYTNSPLRAEAILYQAEARLGQSNFTGAIDLLQASAAGAGQWQSQYVFWMAKARLAAGDLTRAAGGFGEVARQFPSSPVRLEAAYDEAEVHYRTGDWRGVIRLLQQPNGPFEVAAGQDAKSEFAARGFLLLGEALLHEHRLDEGQKMFDGLDSTGWSQDLRWRYQYLLCRLRLADGRAEAALSASTNLLSLDSDPARQASSIYLQGQILEKLGRATDALRVYTNNLAESVPPEDQQLAMASTIPLTLALNPLPQAIQALDTLIGRRKAMAPGQDLARVSLGELYLKAFATPPDSASASNALVVPATNLLAGALTNFNLAISNFPHSSLLAKAHLDRGWCEWLSTNDPAAAKTAAKVDFEEAAAHLTFPPDQAVARFKLADAQFFFKDYTNAAVNYGRVLTNTTPEVTNALFDLALYQLAEADIHRGDEDGTREAGEAVDKIVRWYPASYFAERGSLLMGEELNRRYDYTRAREVFTGLKERSPHSPLLPEVELAIARTFDYEGQPNQAIAHYKEWETNHADDPLLPEVQFHLAFAQGKAGLTNDALADFTNFVARFPTNDTFAPWALNWVADYYYNVQDYHSAETYYQKLFQNYSGAGELAYQALFWAGKSAFLNQETKDAHDYFVKLVNLSNAPPALILRGYLALGDTLFQQFLSGQTNENYLQQAVTAVSTCTNGAPTNAIAVEALGRLGDYYKMWADKTTNTYAFAKQMYETILHFPPASVSVSARSQAETGLGMVAEREHDLPTALEYYCNVVYKYDPAHFDPYWVEQAGEAAARICEDQQHWTEAIPIYRRVLEAVPALRPVLERKIAAALARKPLLK
jgi:TolA-binding protein